MNCIR
ncbi:hypothetical protein CP04DC42_1101A, partial [Chlamydia psittaci 04DC42]|jgi:hypothetical protein